MPPSALPVALLLVICVACASMSAAARPGGGGHWGGGGLRLPAIPHAAPYSSTPRIAPYVPPPRIAPRFSLPSAPHISAPRIAPPRLAPTIAHVPSVAPFPPQQLARPAPFPQGPGMTGQISSAHAPTGGIQRIALPTVQQASAFEHLIPNSTRPFLTFSFVLTSEAVPGPVVLKVRGGAPVGVP